MSIQKEKKKKKKKKKKKVASGRQGGLVVAKCNQPRFAVTFLVNPIATCLSRQGYVCLTGCRKRKGGRTKINVKRRIPED